MVRALAVGDVRLEADPPLLVVSKGAKDDSPDPEIRSAKTRKIRVIPIAGAVLDWLARHMPAEASAEAPLFTNPRTGKRWSHWGLRDTWIKAAKRAGVDAGLYEGTKHSFATEALARTGNQRAIQKYLGHSDPRSTERYAQLTDQALLDVVGVRTVH